MPAPKTTPHASAITGMRRRVTVWGTEKLPTPYDGHVALQKKANDTNRNAYANPSRSLGCTRLLVRLSRAVVVAS